ncbi:hypothetical protein GCM10010124_21310 [Pilimelia terevasa]|uniref:Pyrrolo-quinoline quinone repeat domain-containing protein n=2 Tax=Pilimelia terevasa TaxID=53372 RepID=A0A8J3BKW8_9ACTN|nr:hypothetical protein GCM10010124_21310 [Pilimelia terevasa]
MLVPAVPSAAAGRASGAGWPSTGFDDSASSYNRYETRLTAATVNGLEEGLSLPLPHPDMSCQGGGRPVLAGGLLYVPDGKGLGAYDPRSGDRRWYVPLDTDDFVGQIDVVQGRLVLSQSYCRSFSDSSGTVTVYDAATGAKQWSRYLDVPVRTMVAGDVLVAGGAESTDAEEAAGFRLADGEVLWQRHWPLLGRVLVNGAAAVGTPEGDTDLVDPATGRTLHTVPGSYAPENLGADRTLTLESNRNVTTAREAATRRVRWRSSSAQRIVAQAVGPRTLHQVAEQELVALGLDDGAQRYRVPLDDQYYSMVGAGDLLYLVGLAKIQVRRADTGAPVADLPIPDDGSVVVADGDVYLNTDRTLTQWRLPARR